MTYMTFEKQVSSHLNFLNLKGLEVRELKIDADFIRCCSIGKKTGRGQLCYKTTKSQLKNGLTGLATWCRSKGGKVETHNSQPVHS